VIIAAAIIYTNPSLGIVDPVCTFIFSTTCYGASPKRL
jgi:hypothetical protein